MRIVEGKIVGFKCFTSKDGTEWYVINVVFSFACTGQARIEGDDCKAFWVRSNELTFKPAVGGKVKVGVRYGGSDLVQ